jgi:hypothetical protein
MSHCEDCYGVNTIEPCAEIGCIETNYGKCITYSGANLFCSLGPINTVTFTGTAVPTSPSVTVVLTATGGTGSGATFSITRTASSTAYTVSVVNKGNGYAVGDVLTILGSALGGAAPANNLTITVATLNALIDTTFTMDAAIKNLHDRLCGLTPSGLLYSGFNYSCLRQGGDLTGLGTPISTQQQFVESASAALCALNTRVVLVEKPTFTVPSCTVGLVSGTSTLGAILTEYGSKLCGLSTGTGFTITGVTVPGTCTFSTIPASTANLGTWIDWIVDNVCSLNSTLSGTVSSLSSSVSTINTFLGSTAKFNNSANCLTAIGGTLLDSAHTTIGLLTTKLCSVDTTVNAIPSYIKTDSIGLNWVGCYGSAPYSYTNTATTIQTQLQRIVNVLNTQRVSFDATYFSESALPCGSRSVTLTPAAVFSCSSLNSCSINALGDVVVTVPSDPHVLYYNGANWVNKNINALVTFTSSNSTVTINSTTTPGNVNIDLVVPNATSARYDLTPSTVTGATNGNSTAFVLTPGTGYINAVKEGNTAVLNGNAKLTSTGALAITANAPFQFATVPAAITPSHNAYLQGYIIIRSVAPYTNVDSTAPLIITVTTSGAVTATLLASASLSLPTAGQNVEIVIGGNSYSMLA